MRLLRQAETKVPPPARPSLSIGGQAGCCEAGAASVLPLSSQHQRILPRPPLPLFSSYLKQYSTENLVGIKTIMTH